MVEHFYPVFMKIQGKRCVVIGGGNIAERKITSLIHDGAKVTVISPQITDTLRSLVNQGMLEWKEREYRPGDLVNAFLVFAATNSRHVNNQVVEDAQKHGILLNAADDPDACDFIVPSSIRRGKLQIAISTSGASPALNKRICEDLQNQFGKEYEILLEWLQTLRFWLQSHVASGEDRQRILTDIVQSPILQLLRSGEIAAAKHIVHTRIGNDKLL